MSSPFDDPEFRAQLAKMGVAHKPGMAADLMAELAPLLKADGVDLDDLGDVDLDALNAAIARAAERRNLELLTPIGAQRTAAFAVLRVFAGAVADRDDALARTVLDSIQPEPEPDDGSPAVSHIIGVSLGLLDSWYSETGLRGSLGAVRAPHWHRKMSRAAASDLVALARKNRAFDSAGSLIARHSGLGVFEGGALVVAAALIAIADSEGAPLDEVAERMLDGKRTEERMPGPAAPAFVRPDAARPRRGISGDPARRANDLADRRLLRDFSRWLEETSPVTGADVLESVRLLEVILHAMRVVALELGDPGDFEDIIDALFEAADDSDADDPDEVLLDQLNLLHEYVHFQLRGSTAADWKDAHDLIEDALDELTPPQNPFAGVLAEAEDIPAEERLSGYLAVPLVAGVRDLLRWIDRSRPITPSGMVRRADIADIARMLGIDAVGVARVSYNLLPDAPRQILSMSEIPELRAWWEALLLCDLIELSATRVRPGLAAAEWLADSAPPLDAAEKMIGMFVNEIVNPDERAGRFELVTSAELLRELLIALRPEAAEAFEGTDENIYLAAAVRGRMRGLAALGLVTESEEDGSFAVPRPLRGVVARGLLTAMAVIGTIEDLEE